MAKSPISLLQELSIKEGYVPIYDYIDVRNDGLNSRFVCRVICKNLNSNGTGCSKKEAKHNAAEKMLSLLGMKNEISLSPVANKIQSSVPTKVSMETLSPLRKQNSDSNNYIGLLQEYCVQRKLSTENILYEIVDEIGPPHMKTFTIEVRVGSLQERGTAQCKKTAKQEAARKLLQNIHSNIMDLSKVIKNKTDSKETLEDNIRKFGIEISECTINKSRISEISEKARSLYIECTNKVHKVIKRDTQIKDSHSLFKEAYSNKIPYNMREKMQRIIQNADQTILIREIRRDIEQALGVKIEEFILRSLTEKRIICLRLLTCPKIIQFGMGETKDKAEISAMYNIIVTILALL